MKYEWDEIKNQRNFAKHASDSRMPRWFFRALRYV
jgi:uncharacterized DUF497 family protein